MQAEAASEIRLAAAVDIEPPYPWRAVEIRALGFLGEAFPDDERLKKLRTISTKAL
jgi:hypothetical protein